MNVQSLALASAIGLIATALLPAGAIRPGAAVDRRLPLRRPNIVWISNEDMSPHLGVLRRRVRAHAGPGSPGAASRPLHARVHDGAGVRTQPRRDHHRDVSDGDRRAAHAHDRRHACPSCRDRTSRCRRSTSRRFPSICGPPATTRRTAPRPTTSSACRSRSGTTSAPNAHWRNRADKDQPFFSVFNLEVTHESQIFPSSPARKGKPLVTDPATIEVPPYYPDTPVVREELARMYDNIADMDGQVGEILKQLEDDGLADNTIVFYWSDHGDGVPRAKRSLYDSGLRVPLMIRWPNGARVDRRRRARCSDELVSFIDLAPTVLALAGVDDPGAPAGTRARRAAAGTGARVRLRRARSHGHRIRHDALGARRALPLHPQLLAGAALRRAHHLSQPERDHAGVAQAAGRGQADRPGGAVDADRRGPPRSCTTRRPIRIRSTNSPPTRRIAPRSSGCAARSPSGWRASAIRVWSTSPR